MGYQTGKTSDTSEQTMILQIELLWETIEILRSLYGFIRSSPFAVLGAVLLIASIILSAINGLIDIAIYLTLIGAILFFIIGVANFFFPGLVPLWIPFA